LIKKVALSLVLVTLLIASSLAVVFSTYETRTLFIKFSKLQENRDYLAREWSQLLLEQSVWGSQTRIEQIARTKLNMKVPASEDLRFIK